VAAARLAGTLRLPPTVELIPGEIELIPASMGESGRALHELVAHAMRERAELRQAELEAESSRYERKGSTVGPLVPTLTAQAYFGGLGGGPGNETGNFDDASDYFIGLSWRVGPGGLFDRGRIRANAARERVAMLRTEQVRIDIQRQVVEAHARVQSASEQMEIARGALEAAGHLLRLSRERQEFGTAVVLEGIQAQQELTRARLDYFEALAGCNRAQFDLRRAIGSIAAD
jgi:outer membrane protein